MSFDLFFIFSMFSLFLFYHRLLWRNTPITGERLAFETTLTISNTLATVFGVSFLVASAVAIAWYVPLLLVAAGAGVKWLFFGLEGRAGLGGRLVIAHQMGFLAFLGWPACAAVLVFLLVRS